MQPETLWEKIKHGIKESAATAAEKAEYLGKLGRIRLDMARTRRAIHDAFAELGGCTYGLLGENPDAVVAQHEDVQRHIQKIEALEARLQAQEAEFKALQATDVVVETDADEEV